MDGPALLAIGAPLIGIAAVWVVGRDGDDPLPRATDAHANDTADAADGDQAVAAGPVGVRWLIVCLGATAIVFGTVAIARLFLRGGGFFTVIRFLYHAIVIAAPIAIIGAAVVLGLRRGLTAGARVLVGLAVATAGVGVYATHIEPWWLRVDRLDVTTEMATEETIRIGVLADIQTRSVGSYEHDAVDRVLDADPDVIIIAGDVFQGGEREFDVEVDGFAELMSRLSAPHGVYAVEGNIDRVAWLAEMTEGTEVQVLVDDIVELDIRGQVVRIGGSRDDWSSDESTDMIDELARSDPGDLAILVSHRPDAVMGLPADSTVDVTISGHTHGGQVVVPFVGPLITFSDVPRSVARGGLHDVSGNLIYQSTGVGLERAGAPQVRFLNRPSIGILDVTSG
ncbi:MAG: metallophosphoesterase [Actinomycetota bacterium]